MNAPATTNSLADPGLSGRHENPEQAPTADSGPPPATQPEWGLEPTWYKDAVIYQLHVKAFYDSNGDGIGDFPGLTQKLEYIKDLGVNTVWLLPFYPSPLRDDGYDIADYRNIHPSYGTMADFRNFIRQAHRLNLKVVTELVINHTSDQHPWFQAARHAPPGSAKRNYYVWSDTDKKWPETRIIFTDTEQSNWAWDPVAKAYYWHRFFSHQPDLNFGNPNVVRAVMRVMRYWFDMGVDAMRLDAIPYLCERDGTNNENLPETHTVLKQLRTELDRLYPNKCFLAEVNQWPEDVREYFSNGDECHMAYHFPLMPRIYMAVAEEDRHPILDIMAQTPDIPENCQWAIFLRNHDELTLEMVTERERDAMYRIYATDPRMRINVGIRRRLAPLMEQNIRRIELVNSLLMSIIGSPILYYGDEIGMGDNFYLGDRDGVRTPMQWSPDRNAGFSRADPQRLYLPPIMDPVYGYESTNVEAQLRSPSSLLNWIRRLIAVRKAHPAFGRGALEFLRPGNRKVLAYVRRYDGEVILCVANLARSAQPVELDLSEFKGRVPLELLGRTTFPPIGDLPYFLTLPAWGFYWFALSADQAGPDWHDSRPTPTEFPVLVIPDGLQALLASPEDGPGGLRALMARRVREQLEHQVLPSFLGSRGWFNGQRSDVAELHLLERGEWNSQHGRWLLAIARIQTYEGAEQTYAMPLSLAWEDEDYERSQSLLRSTMARVRQHARVGVLYDAFWDDAFCRSIIESMAREERYAFPNGQLEFSRTRAFVDLASYPPQSFTHPPSDTRNTMVYYGENLALKGYRRLRWGISPEYELGRYLTEVAAFAHSAPMLGALHYRAATGECVAVAVLQAYVEHQGSLRDYTAEYLGRFIERSLALAAPVAGEGEVSSEAPEDAHVTWLTLVRLLGERTAQLHLALADAAKADHIDHAAFDPEPLAGAALSQWLEALEQALVDTLELARKRLPQLSGPAHDSLAWFVGAGDDIRAWMPRLDGDDLGQAIRVHGDLDLSQVLLRDHDFVIVDFEGDPTRSLVERRQKRPALRDVGSMLRAFDEVAIAALDRGTAERPEDRQRLSPALAQWIRSARHTYLDAYALAVAGSALLPTVEETGRRILALCELDGALSHIRFELENRPALARVPVEGLFNLLHPHTEAQEETS
ncbi:MAG: maltose alpha-D-glucosyltransferase [Rhodocyclaceae bacterium]